MFILNNIVRPHILQLKPYSSARDEYSGTEGIFLDANENALGSATLEDYSRYPDPMQWAVKERIADIYKIKKEQIFLGNGSDEPIELLVKAFCIPNIDNIILLPPTYGMYKVSAELNEIEIKSVPLTIDFQLDTKSILAKIDKHTKIIFVCSPNNPTGNLLIKEDIIQLLENFNGIVVVDQAYIDFAENANFISYLGKFSNLVILNTLSKAWGMASLRLGMAFGSIELIAILNKIKPPYNINGYTQKIALEGLNRIEIKNNFVEELNDLKSKLITALENISFVLKVFLSDTNFLLVKFEDSTKIFKYLIDNKVIARDRSKEINCENCIRITVGTQNENNRLIDLLKSYQ